MAEPAEQRALLGKRHAVRVDLPDESALDLLARQPGAPRRGAAGAVAVGVGEHAAGAGDPARGIEAELADAAPLLVDLAVGDVDPSPSGTVAATVPAQTPRSTLLAHAA